MNSLKQVILKDFGPDLTYIYEISLEDGRLFRNSTFKDNADAPK